MQGLKNWNEPQIMGNVGIRKKQRSKNNGSRRNEQVETQQS